jgi:phosphoenolpyruvate carboxylase
MVSEVKNYDANMLMGVSRSFSHFLALSNCAENYHKIRYLKSDLLASDTKYGLWTKEDSCAGTINHLLHDLKVSPNEIVNALKNQKVEIVLTAHPTEVNRRTMLTKQHKIVEILEECDRVDISKFDKMKLEKELIGI